MEHKAPIIADKFEIVTPSDGFAMAVARIEGPVHGFAVSGSQRLPVRSDDQVVNHRGVQLYPKM